MAPASLEELHCEAAPDKPPAVPPPPPAKSEELRWLRRCVGLAAGGDELRWLRRCAGAAAKGFAIGAVLKGGLALFSVLVRLRSRSRSPRSRKAGAMTNDEEVVLALKETVRYGMFLGTFAGTYVSIDECIAALWGCNRSLL